MSSLKAALEEKLNDQQLKFALKYYETMNATEAALHAGYSKKSAKQQGSRLLTHDDVSAYISELKKEAARKSEVTVQRCIQELADLAFVNIADAFNEHGQLKRISEMPENVQRALTDFSMTPSRTTVKIGSKRDAIETIMKYLGAFEKDNEQKKPDALDLSRVPTEMLRELLPHIIKKS